MKTQILQLEAHDDWISIRDKMNWGQTGRILLVWPPRGRILQRKLDLVIVQRRAAALGAQLALVTRDGEIRRDAHELGIPVYSTLRKAQHAHWRPPRWVRRRQQDRRLEPAGEEEKTPLPLPERPPHEEDFTVRFTRSLPARLGVFSLGVLALLSIAAILVPSAQISLAPEQELQTVRLEVAADPAASSTNLAGIVPARLRQVVVEGRDSMPASGQVIVPDALATGRVRFTNLTDQPLQIPAGSVVRSSDPESPQRFATLEEAVLPAGPGTSLLLDVLALEPGSQGNLERDQITAVEGSLGTKVSVTNPQPTRYGRDRTLRAPTQQERVALKNQLTGRLRQAALEELRQSLEPGDLLLAQTLELKQTLESAYDPALEGDPADAVSLRLRLEFEARVIPAGDLHTLAAAALDANLPAGFEPTSEKIEIVHLGEPEASASRFTWQIEATRPVQAGMDPARAVQLALGLDPQAAGQRLVQGLSLDRAPHIQLQPSWWPRLPFLPFRIEVLEDKG